MWTVAFILMGIVAVFLLCIGAVVIWAEGRQETRAWHSGDNEHHLFCAEEGASKR